MNDNYDDGSLKPEVNMLPCSIRTKWLYWIMTALFIVVSLMRLYIYYQKKSNPFTYSEDMSLGLIILSVGAVLTQIVFVGLFAKACSHLRHHESTYIYALMIAPILMPLQSLSKLSDNSNTELNIALITLSVVCFVLAFLLAKAFRKHYSGALNDLGFSIQALLKLVLITDIALIVFMLLIFWSGNETAMDYVSIISTCIGFYIIYRFFSVLWQVSNLLDAGNEIDMTNRELEQILECHEPLDEISTENNCETPELPYDCDDSSLKPEVDMLPCPIRTKWLYWIMAALFIAVVLMIYNVFQVKSDSAGMKMLSLGAALTQIAFAGLFAKACSHLRHHESKYLYTLILVSILILLLTLIDKSGTAMDIALITLSVTDGVLAFLLSKTLRKYYRGALNDLGYSILAVIEIVLFTVVPLIILLVSRLPSNNDNAIGYVFILFICMGFYISYRYLAVLWQVSKLLDAGNGIGMTNNELEQILECHEPFDEIKTDKSSGFDSDLSFKTLELRNKWYQLSSTAKVVIFAIIALVCAGCIWMLTRSDDGQEMQDDETWEQIESSYEGDYTY